MFLTIDNNMYSMISCIVLYTGIDSIRSGIVGRGVYAK